MPPYQVGKFGPVYVPPPFSQVVALVGAALLVMALLIYGPALVNLVRTYLAYRARRAEARRLETIELNMRRSEWPQFKQLPPALRDHGALFRVRAAGRGGTSG